MLFVCVVLCCVLLCVVSVRVEVLQDKQLCWSGKPSQFPADPVRVLVDLCVWDQFGALQPLSSTVSDDGSPLLPSRLQSVQVQQHLILFIFCLHHRLQVTKLHISVDEKSNFKSS